MSRVVCTNSLLMNGTSLEVFSSGRDYQVVKEFSSALILVDNVGEEHVVSDTERTGWLKWFNKE